MLKHYYEICKPRVVALMLITSIIGMHLATFEPIPFSLIFITNLGIALAASSAAIFNQLLEIKIDDKMQRTKERPIASGKISKINAFIFAVTLGISGHLLLYMYVNTLTTVLTFATVIGYALFYTAYLKRATPQNIVIGGAAGASPPLLGWVAVTNNIDPHALLLMLIIYTWTPPHFWALAISKQEEYAKTPLPMLPNTHGIEFTKISVVLYSILLLVVSVLPYITGMSGWLYFYGALLLGTLFLIDTIKLYYHPKKEYGMKTFGFSIVYLFLIFTLLLIDHYFIMS